ncbi:MAG: hypothetical protein AMS24_00225 [Chlamydiae bacterium SM23_39]|nr:MAG: hypothetical protein AMS24_00225 [Chlamydiae bacterium SM23_39]
MFHEIFGIYDRNFFQKFLKLDLLEDRVPGETTILHFSHLLEKHKLTKEIFLIFSRLTEKGFFIKEGTIVDAIIIHSPF